MTNDVYLYTLGEPDAREWAFPDLLTSPVGQRVLLGSDLLVLEPPVGW